MGWHTIITHLVLRRYFSGLNPRKHTSRTVHWMSLNIIHCLLLPFRMTIHESKFCPNNLSKRLNHKSDSLSVTLNYIESHLDIFKSKLTRSHTLTLLPIVKYLVGCSFWRKFNITAFPCCSSHSKILMILRAHLFCFPLIENFTSVRAEKELKS